MKDQQSRTGFVYLWRDSIRNKFYLGSHLGYPTDGYTGSNRRFKCALKSRPNTFKRRLLEVHDSITSKELLAREQMWLQLISPPELGTRYYNEKNVAAGGDVVSHLSAEKRAQHRQKSIDNQEVRIAGLVAWRETQSVEDLSSRAKYARSCVKSPHKLKPMLGKNNPFYGKQHSPDIIEKIKNTKLKNNLPSGMCGKRHTTESKAKIQQNNPNRTPIVTPFGLFLSAEDFARTTNLVTANSLRTIIQNCDAPISWMRATRSPLFTADHVGKTPREVGYYPSSI